MVSDVNLHPYSEAAWRQALDAEAAAREEADRSLEEALRGEAIAESAARRKVGRCKPDPGLKAT